MYDVDPPATPEEIAAIVAVLEATRDDAPERAVGRSGWRTAAMREAIAPFDELRRNAR